MTTRARARRGLRVGRLTVGAAVFASALLIVGCGGSGDQRAGSAQFAGGAVSPVKPAPPLHLRDQKGQAVDLSQFRGKAVLVTFLYTRCPDICPLITGNLHAAQERLGSAATELQILAVSVDPRGDTPVAVTRFLRRHQMTGRMEWLTGSRPELERTWARWGVAAKVPKDDPELVEHSGQIFGIDANGQIRTVYPPNFEPEQIVTDVPKLAAG